MDAESADESRPTVDFLAGTAVSQTIHLLIGPELVEVEEVGFTPVDVNPLQYQCENGDVLELQVEMVRIFRLVKEHPDNKHGYLIHSRPVISVQKSTRQADEDTAP